MIRDSLTSPSAIEYATGVSPTDGERATVRTDFIYALSRLLRVADRHQHGQVADKLGRPFDLTSIENTDALTRRYAGLSTKNLPGPSRVVDLGVTYTLSRTWGISTARPLTADRSDAALQYPEYKREAGIIPRAIWPRTSVIAPDSGRPTDCPGSRASR